MKTPEKWFVGLPGCRLKPLSVAVTVDDIRAIQWEAIEEAAAICADEGEPDLAARIRAAAPS